MRVTTEQITRGFARFLREAVAPKITDDAALKVAVLFVSKRIEKDAKAAAVIIQQPAILAIAGADEDDQIDIDDVAGDMVDVVEGAGGLPISIPAIPIISPSEKTLTFTAADVRQLVGMIKDAA